MTLLGNFVRTSSRQCRDPIYRVRDSSKDVSGEKNLSWASSDKSADAINRVPTLGCLPTFFASLAHLFPVQLV
jgi:hypothetical protein